jgi:succinyl-diaminopimelate desuccinylase
VTASPNTAGELLKALLRCASVSPDDDGVLDVLEAFLTPLGFACTRLTFEGDGSYPVDNLFATRGAGGRHLLFAGHADVVPPGDVEDWVHPPFSGAEMDGQIWGRGAVDMKSGVAAFCAAIAAAVESGTADAGKISLAITNDEEADAINGTEKLMTWAADQGYRFDFALVGEPSSARKVGDRIKVGRRGSLSGQIVVSGQQGHAAYPELARNPLPVMARVAHALTETPIDTGNDRFQPSNLELTSIDTGNPATNVIPARSTLKFNIRYNDQWVAETISGWVRDRIAQIDARGCEIVLAQVGRAAESFLCPAGEGVSVLDRVIEELTGKSPEHSTTGGTSDARFLAPYCPVVECGLVGDLMHQTDERVPVSQVDSLREIYSRFISGYLTAE